MDTFHSVEREILAEIQKTLNEVNEAQVEELIESICQAEKVFFVGVGRVLLSLQGIAKRLRHIGIDTVVVGQITEPAITNKDLLIVGSGSGESGFPLLIARKAKEFGAQVAHIGANPSSSMKNYTDVFVRIPVSTKLKLRGEITSVQPMTSLFEQSLLLLGDSIAIMLIRKKAIDINSLWNFHANLE